MDSRSSALGYPGRYPAWIWNQILTIVRLRQMKRVAAATVLWLRPSLVLHLLPWVTSGSHQSLVASGLMLPWHSLHSSRPRLGCFTIPTYAMLQVLLYQSSWARSGQFWRQYCIFKCSILIGFAMLLTTKERDRLVYWYFLAWDSSLGGWSLAASYSLFHFQLKTSWNHEKRTLRKTRDNKRMNRSRACGRYWHIKWIIVPTRLSCTLSAYSFKEGKCKDIRSDHLLCWQPWRRLLLVSRSHTLCAYQILTGMQRSVGRADLRWPRKLLKWHWIILRLFMPPTSTRQLKLLIWNKSLIQQEFSLPNSVWNWNALPTDATHVRFLVTNSTMSC